MNKCNWYSIGQIGDPILERVECIREFQRISTLTVAADSR